jgi:hypothetical protein
MMFVIKAEVSDPEAEALTFSAQKTMYGAKQIAKRRYDLSLSAWPVM